MLKNILFKKILIAKNRSRRGFFDLLVIGLYNTFVYSRKKVREASNPQVSSLYLGTKNIIRKIGSSNYTFVSLEELNFWTNEWIKSFPQTYDLIVGIPRSGLLVATIIACKLGKPLTTPDLFSTQLWHSRAIHKPSSVKRILLVDDSVTSGKTLESNMKLLKQNWGSKVEITTAALIISPEMKEGVNLFYKIIPKPRLFEWNMMHSPKNMVIATDFDGVLCPEPPPGIELDEDNYRRWLETVNPYLIPAFPVDYIITNRLSKYRDLTEEWLDRHGVKYGKLLMWEDEKREDKKRLGIARHKVDSLRLVKPDIYWESNFEEGRLIWEATKIPVVCLDKKVILN